MYSGGLTHRTGQPSKYSLSPSSSSRMRVIYHNWSAMKQRPHPQSVAEISRHSVLSGDRIWQCETSSGSRHKDTDECLSVAISFCRHRSVRVIKRNVSALFCIWPPTSLSFTASILHLSLDRHLFNIEAVRTRLYSMNLTHFKYLYYVFSLCI